MELYSIVEKPDGTCEVFIASRWRKIGEWRGQVFYPVTGYTGTPIALMQYLLQWEGYSLK